MNMSHITDRLAASFNIYLSGIIDSLPTLVAGLIVLIVGWLLAKLVRTIVRRALAGKLDSIVQSTGMNGLFRKLGIHSVGRFTASVFYGAVLVVFVMAAADIMGMERLQAGVAAFIAYLSSLTNVNYSATQYALFSSMMLLLPKWVAGFSGRYVDAFGYEQFFVTTALMGVPVLALVWLASRRQAQAGGHTNPDYPD